MRCSSTNVVKITCEQWENSGTLKRPEQKKYVAQFVRWEIYHWTLLWKKISLWYYCPVYRSNDKGPSISRLIISRTSGSKWTSFLLFNLSSRNLLFRFLKFIEILWYFSENWTMHRRHNSSLLTNSFPHLWYKIALHLVQFRPRSDSKSNLTQRQKENRRWTYLHENELKITLTYLTANNVSFACKRCKPVFEFWEYDGLKTENIMTVKVDSKCKLTYQRQ